MKLAALLVASIFAHGAAFAAFGHLHGNSTKTAANVQTLAIDAPEILPVQEIPAPDLIKEAPAENVSAKSFPTHTHDYPVPASHDLTPHDHAIDHRLSTAGANDHDRDRAEDEHAHDAAPVETAPAPLHFSMALGGGSFGASTSVASGGGTGNGTQAAPLKPSDAVAEGPLPESAVDERARLVASKTPEYPAAAAAADVEAKVAVEIIVDANGNVTSARALSHVGYGLDEAAVRGVRAYRFSPAKRGGRAVAVRMNWIIEFRLG